MKKEPSWLFSYGFSDVVCGSAAFRDSLEDIGSACGIADHTCVRQVCLDYYVTCILELYFQWYRNETSLSLEDIRDFVLGIYEADQNGFLMNFERKRIKEI